MVQYSGMMEILAPAGNEECVNAAIDCGADAVYLGYSAFSARASAENFDLIALGRVIRRAHFFGVKVYITMNTLVKQSELAEFLSVLVEVHNLGVDAVLLQDLYLGKAVHEAYPDICLHLSTQAGVNNVYGGLQAREFGFSRVVLARETPIEEIRKIASVIETEVFVQGALCSSFSGQCYLSSFVGGNSGNRGRCKQPCRKRYTYRTQDNTECYALSLSDLCVGERVLELIEAGVSSLKIEGRMRRPEYVAAAVRYYKRITQGKNADKAYSDLKRTYNRGNYTQGLAFGQDKRFLSPAVQGHIGEKVGVVKVVGGKYFVSCRERFTAGDGFKILREGREVGGASFAGVAVQGFYIRSAARLKNGDGVFITTDTALAARLTGGANRKKALAVQVSVYQGVLYAVCGNTKKTSTFALDVARTSPLTAEELARCFEKTEEYPFTASVQANVDGAYFAPKAQLNAFRRDFYRKLYEALSASENTLYPQKDIPMPAVNGKPQPLTAVIGDNFDGVEADIYIYKPRSYARLQEVCLPAKGEKFLYLPAFLPSGEWEKILPALSAFDGVYADGHYGVYLAKKQGKKVFAGTGLNITNSFAAGRADFDYYALSKELSFAEQKALAGRGAFVLSAGGLKVMDFIYCPFSRKCATCEDRDEYLLTDENDRAFTLRRYRSAGGVCRFELYNGAYLCAPQEFAGTLIDGTTAEKTLPLLAENRTDGAAWKEILKNITAGHSKNSIL